MTPPRREGFIRLQPLVFSLLAASVPTRGHGQAVTSTTASGALTPGPHNVVLNGIRFFYSVGGTAADAPPARYVEFENSGHFVYLDEPDRLARVVTSFIKSAP
jgi:hypothetical protein